MYLGIIGGNGVVASNMLLKMLEEKTTKAGAYRDSHHLKCVLFQASDSPSRSMYLEGRGESFISSYRKIGKQMEYLGCTHLCITCNTAHFAFDQVLDNLKLVGINMIELTKKKVFSKYKTSQIGLIASDGSIKSMIYGSGFILPDDKYQKITTLGICNTKRSIRFNKKHAEHPNKLFAIVCDHLRAKGAKCIILGCTDISSSFEYKKYIHGAKKWGGVEIYDSLEILADEILDIYFKEKQV